MNIARILNRAAAVALSPSFQIPKDGKFHLACKGEFPGVVYTADGEFNVIQVNDAEAFTSMVNNFAADKRKGAPDLLVDRDHLSSDPQNETVAEGWIQNVEVRSDDFFADIRLSAQGEADIKGGNYRFISGVWDVTPIGQDEFTKGCRVRPFKLTEAGLTNRPNIAGLNAVANRTALSTSATAQEVARIKRVSDRARAVHNRAKQLVAGSPSSRAFARAWRDAMVEFPSQESD